MTLIVAITAISVVAAIVVVALGLRTPEFTVDRGGLRISNSLFGRTIPLADIDRANVRIIDLKTSPQLAPRWRKFGIGISGHQSGWYLLQNGSNALLFLTRSDEVIYLDTRKGYSILISPTESNLLIGKIKLAE